VECWFSHMIDIQTLAKRNLQRAPPNLTKLDGCEIEIVRQRNDTSCKPMPP